MRYQGWGQLARENPPRSSQSFPPNYPLSLITYSRVRKLLFQSYVLHQERNVLSISNPVATSASASSGAALSRSGTRKHQRPVQPLVNLSAASAALDSPTPKVFEPGSLLAKRGIWGLERKG